MKILIVEDEALAIEKLHRLLDKYPQTIEVIETLDSVKKTVEWFGGATTLPDLILMDIHLSDGLSFDIFAKVDIKTPVVFVTAYDQYALKAFKANGIDYLLKPIDYNDLKGSLDKFQTQFKQKEANPTPAMAAQMTSLLEQFKHLKQEDYKTRFLVKAGNKLIPILSNQIAYFYKDDLVFLLTQDNKKYHVNYSLDEMERMLDPRLFFRANRQFMVNVQAIESIHPYFKGKLKLKLKPTPTITNEVIVSQEKASKFKEWVDS
ncbi:LytTR family DNA-binding domain-containing protein [uncultured Microscilla sp.]|uniref:LytR/AlgR family response regulator transcription factor n=1 Tax=uncultured Microscilla sp. TaxID=432653 RepID=UPI00262C2CE9|nr:LytTR family DNA-binding domain-containing protein [uncultured Microscilla sp.]